MFESFIIWSKEIITIFGYFGVIFISLISSSTVVFPLLPLEIIVFFSGSILSPIAVGILAGIGSATGEMVGYFVGLGGGKILYNKHRKRIKGMNDLFKKYGGGAVIFFLAMLPLMPFDIVGIFCGLIKYDIKKLYMPLVLGKSIRFTIIAFAGYYGISWILDFVTLGA